MSTQPNNFRKKIEHNLAGSSSQPNMPHPSSPINPNSVEKPVRIIPGPAGLIQQAKIRKSSLGVDCGIPTQEIAILLSEDVGEDEHFSSDPWICAVQYEADQGSIISGCLGSIAAHLTPKGKLEKIVAVIKTCTPNALGDLTVTLKDPTGTINGTIHHKVVAHKIYDQLFKVGAVLILQNVSVFIPKPSIYYLNITLKNVVKVFPKDAVFEF